MDFEVVREVTAVLTEIQKYISTRSFLVLNNDKENILAGLHYDKFEVSEKNKLKIIGKIRKINRKVDINHIVINEHICLFQGRTMNKVK